MNKFKNILSILTELRAFCIRSVRRCFLRFTRKKFKIDKRLSKYYNKHSSNCVCKNKDLGVSCCVYVSCGPVPCDKPCKYCLFWEGYGLDNDIKNKCHDWIAKNFA